MHCFASCMPVWELHVPANGFRMLLGMCASAWLVDFCSYLVHIGCKLVEAKFCRSVICPLALWSDSNCFHCCTRRSFMFTSAIVYISLKHCLVSNIFSLPITVIKLSNLKTPTVRPSWINVSVLSF